MRLTVDVLTKLNCTTLLPGEIGYSLPDIFWHYDRRMWEPGGIQRDLPVKRRGWRTDTGRANFVTPQALDGDFDRPDVGRNVPIPMWHYAVGSKTPAAKSIPVTVHSDGDAIIEPDMEDRSNDQA